MRICHTDECENYASLEAENEKLGTQLATAEHRAALVESEHTSECDESNCAYCNFMRVAGELNDKERELEAMREVWEPVAKILMDGNAAHYYDCLPGQRGGPPGEDCSRLCIDLRAFIAALAAAQADGEPT